MFYVNTSVHFQFITENTNIIDGTIYWKIEDSLEDGTDNSDEYFDKFMNFIPEKIFKSTGMKTITSKASYDDGFGNIFIYETSKEVNIAYLNQPIFDLLITPSEPHIFENIEIANVYDDTFPYGNIEYLDFDINNTLLLNKLKTENINYEFSETKQQQINVTIYYNNGLHIVNFEKQFILNMSSTAPIADFLSKEIFLSVPQYSWTDKATDLDGLDDIQIRKFELFLKTGQDYSLINSQFVNQNETFQNLFGIEGEYKLKYTVEDKEGLYSIKESNYNIQFGDSSITPLKDLKGQIILELGWQLVVIPTVNGYYNNGVIRDSTISTIKNYVIDQLINKMGMNNENDLKEYIQICNSYVGRDQNSKFQSYLIGVTNPNTTNNFELAFSDSGNIEFTPFWINVIAKTGSFGNLTPIDWEYFENI